MSATGGGSAAPRTVLVTGATGFLGGALVRRLVDQGYAVHALARAGSDRSVLADRPVTWHSADLLDQGSIDGAVAAFAEGAAGAEVAAIHAAAHLGYDRGEADLQRRVNVDGTQHVLMACRRYGIGRVVHVSSVVAVGHAPDGASRLDEDAVFNGAELRCGYVDTKRAAEELALVADDLRVTVVNPGAVFGPAPRPSNTTRFLARIARGGLGPFAPPGSLSVVGVDDVAEGLLLALERGRAGRRYLLTDENLLHRELFELAAAELGARAPRWTLPVPVWRAAVAGAAALDRVRRLELATPQALRLLGVHYRFDSSRAREELGWSPRPFAEVLAGTVAWMRGRGLV